MIDIAPNIFRQRLLIEGYYTIELNEEVIERFLNSVAEHLGFRTYGEPIVFSPAGLGRGENEGYDAFVPLIDSGIAAYFWTEAKFFSIVIYSCKRFSDQAAIGFTQEYFGALGKFVHLTF